MADRRYHHCGGEEHVFWRLSIEELLHCCLIDKIKLRSVPRDQVRKTGGLKIAQ